MHDLLTFQPTDLKSTAYNPRHGEQSLLLEAIESAPSLADIARLADLQGESGKARWTGSAPDPYWDEGWTRASTPASTLIHAARVFLLARAYAEALPRLRSPERRARALEVVSASARAIELRATGVSERRREALVNEVRALVQ